MLIVDVGQLLAAGHGLSKPKDCVNLKKTAWKFINPLTHHQPGIINQK